MPRDSATGRRHGSEWSKTDENIATIADLAIDGALTRWHDRTFDPDTFPEHKKQAEQAKKVRRLPPVLPPISEVAMRPEGSQTLTSLFRSEPPRQEEQQAAEPRSGLMTLDQLDAFIATL